MIVEERCSYRGCLLTYEARPVKESRATAEQQQEQPPQDPLAPRFRLFGRGKEGG